MRYISQLTDGYMLASYDKDTKFKIVKTCYPYETTERSSQEMLDWLKTGLGVEDGARVKTVADLIEVFKGYFDTDKVFVREEMRQLLQNSKLSRIQKIKSSNFYLFFECKFFSIYWISDSDKSDAWQFIKGCKPQFNSLADNYTEVLVLHIHKGVWNYKFLGESYPSTMSEFKSLNSYFRSQLCVTAKEMKLLLNEIYANLDKIDAEYRYFDSSFTEETFMCYQITDDADLEGGGFWAQHQYIEMCRDIYDMFNLYNLYQEGKANVIRDALVAMYGYDVFYKLESLGVDCRYFNFSLYCCSYMISNDERRSILKHEIKILIMDIIKSYKRITPRLYYTIIDGSVYLLTSPAIHLGIKEGVLSPGYLIRCVHKSSLMTLKDGQTMYVEDLSQFIKDYATEFENRLFGYFMLRFMERKWGSIYCYEGVPEVQMVSLPDERYVAAIRPDFRRLFMMNAYSRNNLEKVLEDFYCIERFWDEDINVFKLAFDNIFECDPDFTEDEKVFIYCLPKLMKSGESNYGSYLNIFNMIRDNRLAPQIPAKFLKKLETVFKIWTVVAMPSFFDKRVSLQRGKGYCLSIKSDRLEGHFE